MAAFTMAKSGLPNAVIGRNRPEARGSDRSTTVLGRSPARQSTRDGISTETIYILIATQSCDRVYSDVQWLL